MIAQKKILIIKMGIHRDNQSYEQLSRRKSRLLEFILAEKPLKLDNTLKENGDLTTEVYDTKALAAYMQAQQALHFDEYDLVLGCIDRPVNGDEQILTEVCKETERNKFYILCTTNIMERLNTGNVTLLNYLLNIIYGIYTRKYLGIDPEYHESPGCLLDYCYLERDLIEGCVKPVLCDECAAGISDKETAAQLGRELHKITVPLYIRLLDYIQRRTLLSLGIAVITSILMEILSSFVADKALGGTVLEQVLSTVGPLLVLCIFVAPFFNKKER